MDRDWTRFEIRLGLGLLAAWAVWLALLWWCAESLVGWAVAP